MVCRLLPWLLVLIFALLVGLNLWDQLGEFTISGHQIVFIIALYFIVRWINKGDEDSLRYKIAMYVFAILLLSGFVLTVLSLIGVIE